MAMVFTHMKMGANMKENGKISNKHGKGIDISQTGITTIGNFKNGFL